MGAETKAAVMILDGDTTKLSIPLDQLTHISVGRGVLRISHLPEYGGELKEFTLGPSDQVAFQGVEPLSVYSPVKGEVIGQILSVNGRWLGFYPPNTHSRIP